VPDVDRSALDRLAGGGVDDTELEEKGVPGCPSVMLRRSLSFGM
jgi:hypothetical protein